ncbi:MAG: ClbS/DfsB family four-helix bundle protein [Chloroflexota bacterium]
MVAKTTKEELLDQLDNTRERLLVALEYLPDEALLEPGRLGEWSIADFLSILTAWDAEVVTGLMRLKQGKPPARLLTALTDPAAFNAGRFAENQDRDLDTIFDDFQGARVHLEEWIEEFNDRALTKPGHYKALGNDALIDVITRATVEQEEAHLPTLEQIALEWAEPADDGPAIIPLLDIEPLEPSGNGHNLE